MAVTLKQYRFTFANKKYIVEAGSQYDAILAIEKRFGIEKTPRVIPYSAYTTNLHYKHTEIYEVN